MGIKKYMSGALLQQKTSTKIYVEENARNHNA